MNEIDILKKIASNLTERKSTAALSNYEVLCNNIAFSHDLFEKGIVYLEFIIDHLKSIFNDRLSLKGDFRENECLHPFISVIPSLLLNDLEVIKKLSAYTPPDNRHGITIDNVSLLHRGFMNYNNLATATRQLIDSLVTDSYQLQLLDPKEFNYHVLLSLNSFEKYATKSIRQGLFNQEIEDALLEFRKLNFKDWKNSSITKCQHITFSNKVDHLFTNLNLVASEDIKFKNEINNLFKFSSEFTHIGYISTFFTSQAGSQVVFGSEKSPYLPSTENFSELKYQILETCINFIHKVYLPSLSSCVSKIFSSSQELVIEKHISNLVSLLKEGIKTRNNSYYFFVCSSLIGSQRIIDLPCLCGHLNKWRPPHSNSDLFCTGCGSSYNILAIEGDPGYIITGNGPVKVIGSEAPDFQDLPKEKQQEMLIKVAEFNANGSGN
ncbi:hypothetical protein [Nitrosomonas ureae]|uniref:Uncharacterized protein n=1 Tax=Nitrosomonas ureae TaxID=44577 RepID=A0A1H5U046_9PROT|nr:hypothetical protein [Nitrosomonas ureae]SEF68445.1 hypothetical protein SAMN05216334_10658 [Nitrosomonas ureae]